MASFLVPCGNDPALNTGNNRLSAGDGYVFDASGNTTGDAEGRTFVYDAENKQTSVSDANGVIGQYWYDGDGRRVKKYVPSTGETTVFVYDASSKLVAEYSTVVAAANDARVAYLTADHLASPRINTDQNGAVTARHDYHPFGEEIATSVRTTSLGYPSGSDGVRKQFTGYERDYETDLDFAQARMYGYGHGRFTSPDPLAASANPIRAQSWNRYSYSYNNPLRFSDPSGMIVGDYFNLKGERIGNNGNDLDKSIYVVTDKVEAETIKAAKVFKDEVKSAIVIPSRDVIEATIRAVDRSNNPTADDKKGGHHEEAVVAGTDSDGRFKVVDIKSGAYSPLNEDKSTAAEIDVKIPANSQDTVPINVEYEAHIHPAGVPNISTSINSTVFSSAPIGSFTQEPSQVDIDHATNPKTTYAVVGAGNNTVYFYRKGQKPVTMSYGNFKKLGK